MKRIHTQQPAQPTLWSDLNALVVKLRKPICFFTLDKPKRPENGQLYVWQTKGLWHYSIQFFKTKFTGEYIPEEDKVIIDTLEHIKQSYANYSCINITGSITSISHLMNMKYLGLTVNQQMYLIARLHLDDIWPSCDTMRDGEEAKILLLAFNNPALGQTLPQHLQPLFDALNFFLQNLLNIEQAGRFYEEQNQCNEPLTIPYTSARAVGNDLHRLFHLLVMVALQDLGLKGPFMIPECTLFDKDARIGEQLTIAVRDFEEDFEPWETDLLKVYQEFVDWTTYTPEYLESIFDSLQLLTQRSARAVRISSVLIRLIQNAQDDDNSSRESAETDMLESFESAQTAMLENAERMKSKIQSLLTLFKHAEADNGEEFFSQLEYVPELKFVLVNLNNTEQFRRFLHHNKAPLLDWVNHNNKNIIQIISNCNASQQDEWFELFSDEELQSYILDAYDAEILFSCAHNHKEKLSTLLKKIGPKLPEILSTPEDYFRLLHELPRSLFGQLCEYMTHTHTQVFNVASLNMLSVKL